MKHLSVQKPCSENWEKMTPTQKGAFCQKCCKQVIDFSNLSDEEIKATLLKNSGQEVCGRIANDQLTALNNEFEAWRNTNRWSMQRVSFYAFLFVFGLSIVSCSNQEDEQRIVQLQEKAQRQIIDYDKNVVEEKVIEEPRTVLIDPEITLDEELLEVTVQEQVIDLDEVIIEEKEMRYVTVGGMSYSQHYEDYLQETTPIKTEKQDEYDENSNLIPKEFNAIAFPNPTQGRTTLKFEVPSATHATFELYSMQGKRIRSMETADYKPGTHEIPFDLSNQEPGTYIITILSKDYKESVKVIKL